MLVKIMKIDENKIKEYTGSSFTVKKTDGISKIIFSEKKWIRNENEYAEVFLGKCSNCKKINKIYEGLSYDKVLVGGLGLGLIANYLKEKNNCSVIDVIDDNKELITWINSKEFLHSDINIIEGNALTYTPNKKYDLILMDLWWDKSEITEDIKNTLKDNYLPHLNSDGKLLLPLVPIELK